MQDKEEAAGILTYFKADDEVLRKSDRKDLRQYRTEIVPKMRSRFFRQSVQKSCRHTAVCQEISVQYDGKRSSRFGTKSLDGLCAVLP